LQLTVTISQSEVPHQSASKPAVHFLSEEYI
jgi:hypothetical protein